MTILDFPKPSTSRSLTRDAGIDDLFFFLATFREPALILFIDETEFSRRYEARNPWIDGYAFTVVVDQEVRAFFKIRSIPQWIWFDDGFEVGRLVGAISQHQVMEMSKLVDRSEGKSHE
jgi:hypothetical protein